MSDSSSQSPPDVSAGKRPAAADRLHLVWVGAPLAYGLYELIRKATQLFTG